MTEAVRGIADYAFKHTSVNRIEASVDPETVASCQVLVKSGVSLEGVLRERYFYRGRFRDDVVFSVLRAEWARSSALTASPLAVARPQTGSPCPL
jgi:[ribosomal protein S5]-alanine N-acetyltransferase